VSIKRPTYICAYCGIVKRVRFSLKELPSGACPKRGEGESHFWADRDLLSKQCYKRLKKTDKPIDAKYMYYLGQCYETKENLQDLETAIKWYQEAADFGLDEAMHALGRIYEGGKIIPQDLGKAEEWYSKAAKRGNYDAKFDMAHLYENKNEKLKALYIYEQLARSAAKTPVFQGLISMLGGLPQYWRISDIRKIENWNNADGLTKFGYAYEHGIAGVEKDLHEAEVWYMRAADKGSIYAMVALGSMLSEDLEKNKEKVFEYYRIAALLSRQQKKKDIIEPYFQIIPFYV